MPSLSLASAIFCVCPPLHARPAAASPVSPVRVSLTARVHPVAPSTMLESPTVIVPLQSACVPTPYAALSESIVLVMATVPPLPVATAPPP